MAPRSGTLLQAKFRSESRLRESSNPAEPLRDPAVENAPVEVILAANAPTQSTEDTTRVTAPASRESALDAKPDPADQARLPKPFTVREERYRAQYGWQAFAEALREEALASSKP